MVCGFLGTTPVATQAVPLLGETRPITIAGVMCGKEGARLYMPQSVYSDYTEAGGGLLISLKREKSMVQQFTSLSPAPEVVKAVKNAVSYPLVQVTLGDKTICLFPTTFLTNLGIASEKPSLRLGVDRQSMRQFMHMMEKLRNSFTKHEAESEQLLSRYLYNSPASDHCSVRSIKRVLWGFDPLPEWLERVIMREGSSVSSGSSSPSSASSISTASSVSTRSSPTSASSAGFSSEQDSSFSIGFLSSNRGVSGLVLELGKDEFMRRFFKGGKLLDLSGQELNTLDDFCQACTNFLSDEERLSITELDVANNVIDEIPVAAFSCFPALQSLMLSNNPLRTITSSSLQGLERLEKLFIADIAALSLPEDLLRSVPRLTLFFAPRCGLERCPSLRFAARLKTLDVSGNLITEMPDASSLPDLRVYNAMNNKIAVLNEACLAHNAEGFLMLTTLQLNDNFIESLPTTFYKSMPPAGFLCALHNNPLWEHAHAGVADGLREAGFEELDEESRGRGRTFARDISDCIFDKMCDCVCAYITRRTGERMVESAVWHEIKRRRPARAVETTKADRAQWVYDNQWWIMAGVSLLTGGIGALVGIFIRQASMACLKRAALGGAIGAVFGAIAGYAGCKYFARDGHVYIDTGGDTIHMTSRLKGLYIGTYRIVALLSLFKQYLAALSVSLIWLCHYDRFASSPEGVDALMQNLEFRLYTAQQNTLARFDEPTTLAMLHELTVDAPLVEIRKHTPADIFPGDSLEGVNLAAGADCRWVDVDKLSMLRAIILRFSAAARTVRAALLNRYMGTYDHARICQIMCQVPELQEALSLVNSEIVVPLVAGMEAVGDGRLIWCEEFRRFGGVARQCELSLEEFAQQRASLDRIVR